MSKEIEKKIAELEAKHKKEMDALKQELLKPKFKVGKWYKWYNNSQNYGVLKYLGDNGITCNTSISFHYCHDGFYSDFRELFNFCKLKYITGLATRDEISECFNRYALEKKGYKLGDRVDRKNLPYWSGWGIDTIKDKEGSFDFNHMGYEIFQLGGRVIYCDGIWADIVGKEQIMIGKYEVKKDSSSKTISVGCKTFSILFVELLKGEMEKNGFEQISFDGTIVTIETINKILDMK